MKNNRPQTGTSVLFIYLQKCCDLNKTAMTRKAHIDTPSAQHQVIIDRTECKAIFKDSADRKNFTERLDRIIPETQTRCYGWALMTNHVHLLFKTGMAPLATVMRRLLTGYAVTFNPAFSGTIAVMGSCFRIATSRFCVKRRCISRSWCAIFT